MRELHVTNKQAGQRLDKFLLKYLNLAGKSFIYKMMRKKNIVLNGKKCDGSEKLSEGDAIKLFLAEETIEKFSEIKLQKVSSVRLDIIYEDDNIIIINKPVGMLSQKAKETDESLVEYLIDYLLSSGQLTKEQLRGFKPSICNRLDRNTSGIVVAGKTLAGLQTMAEVFKDRSIHKYYQCVVAGNICKAELIDGYLLKDDQTNQVKIFDSSVEGALPIKTEYLPISRNEHYTRLQVTLITGRSHQIRAHLSYIEHPLLGDTKYGNEAVNKKIRTKYHIKSQLLHSFRLVMPEIQGPLAYLSGKEFTAPLPSAFENFVKAEHL